MSTKRSIAAACAVLGVTLIAGFIADFRSFDETRGGYEPPYTEYTGDPIDWSTVETTERGMRRDGYVVDAHVDCTSGMMHMNVFGLRIPFRKFSPRALAVHKPREACRERGFSPEF